MLRISAGFKALALCFCVLALAACSKKSTPDLEANGGLGRAAVAGSESQFKTEVGDPVYFLVDQSTLTPEGKETLRRQAAWLRQYSDVTVQVEGHADERGTREYNISLVGQTCHRDAANSWSRKASRRAAFPRSPMARSGLRRLCDAEQCWSQNRRAVTVITAAPRRAETRRAYGLP